MDQNVKNFAVEKVKELTAAFSCCQTAKDAAQRWLDALGTEKEMEQTRALIAELEQDLMPLDTLIAFAGSEDGARAFGAEKAGQVAAHGRELKAAGETYCDCPACAVAAAILEKKDLLLG